MSDYSQYINQLASLFKSLTKEEFKLRRDTLLQPWEPGEKKIVEDTIAFYKSRISNKLTKLVMFPPHHLGPHDAKLRGFHWQPGEYDVVGSYHKSVFIMTKFPDPDLPDRLSRQLQSVIDSVATSIKKAGYCPRIARQTREAWLWGNVELYLLGCGLGVAILEDKYQKELNPNVALEWGWMKAMYKPVLFLKERGFAHQRADWMGLISQPFTWPGYDLQFMSWGDGSSVPTSGQLLVIAGTDAAGLLHIRTFDPVGVRTDTYEAMEGGALHLLTADASGHVLSDAPESSLLAARAAAIAALKQQAPGLLPPHALSDAEKDQVLAEATLITGHTPWPGGISEPSVSTENAGDSTALDRMRTEIDRAVAEFLETNGPEVPQGLFEPADSQPEYQRPRPNEIGLDDLRRIM
jgi:hypothetical protein